jgi:hypothetical protein
MTIRNFAIPHENPANPRAPASHATMAMMMKITAKSAAPTSTYHLQDPTPRGYIDPVDFVSTTVLAAT